MSRKAPAWRDSYEKVRRSMRGLGQALRREPWLVVGGAAAALIIIVTIASHGRATPSAPVQSLTGQSGAWDGHRGRLPGSIPAAMPSPEIAPTPPSPSKPALAPTAAPAPAQEATPTAAPTPQHGIWPVSGRLAQGYGWVYQPSGGYWFYNTSWEISAAAGAPVRAAFAGVVQDIERDPVQGLTVTVLSGGGVAATYGGLASTQLQIGEQVVAGSVIGALAPVPAGQSGAPLLHFTVRQGSEFVDPGTFLTARAG